MNEKVNPKYDFYFSLSFISSHTPSQTRDSEERKVIIKN